MRDKTKTGLGMREDLIFCFGSLGLTVWERTNFGLLFSISWILFDQVKEKKGRSEENESLVLKASRKARYGNYHKSLLV